MGGWVGGMAVDGKEGGRDVGAKAGVRVGAASRA